MEATSCSYAPHTNRCCREVHGRALRQVFGEQPHVGGRRSTFAAAAAGIATAATGATKDLTTRDLYLVQAAAAALAPAPAVPSLAPPGVAPRPCPANGATTTTTCQSLTPMDGGAPRAAYPYGGSFGADVTIDSEWGLEVETLLRVDGEGALTRQRVKQQQQGDVRPWPRQQGQPGLVAAAGLQPMSLADGDGGNSYHHAEEEQKEGDTSVSALLHKLENLQVGGQVPGDSNSPLRLPLCMYQ